MENENNVIVTQQAGVITCDFEAAKAYLNARLDEYRGATFTEDSKTFAKKVVASLRAEKKAFADRVKEVKAEYMMPYQKFEVQAKELIGLYDEPINFINDQVDAYEEKRKAEKREIIQKIYDAYIDDMAEYLPLQKIYDQRWENATYKAKDIEQDMIAKVAETRQAVDVISAMESEAVPEALRRFKADLNMANAMAYVNNYEKQKAEILRREEERKRQEEIERIRREERERILAEQKAQAEKEEALRKSEEEKQRAVEEAKAQAAQEVIDSFIPEVNAEAESAYYTYMITLTADEKEKLEIFMTSVGIEWEVME